MGFNFVKAQIKTYLINELESNNPATLNDEGIFIALKKCFKKLDADYHGEGGTTATVAFIIKDEIWVANVGDSRTIFVKADGTRK